MLSEKEILRLANGSDVRGVAVKGVADEPVTLYEEAANRIAAGFVDFLGQKLQRETKGMRIAVGHDSRISARSLKQAIFGALLAKGIQPLDAGLASTPAMFMATVLPEIKADASIMITASHLPYNRNGMKFFTAQGGLEASEVKSVLNLAAKNPEQQGEVQTVEKIALLDVYAQHLVTMIAKALNAKVDSKPLASMHVVVDAGNGAGGFFVDKVLKPLGANTEGSQFLEPDGMFPNHIPNPENKTAMRAIREATLNNHADLGLIFDTDVDRMSAVLPSGEEIARNALIAMMAAILAPDNPQATIVTDSVTSDELTDFLENHLHLKHHRYMRGYRNVIDECIRLNQAGTPSPLAIETSGHGALKENYYLDDGAYLAVKLLIAATQRKREGKNLESLLEGYHEPLESREFRFKITGTKDFRAYGQQVLEAFQTRAEAKGISQAKPSYEGVRLVFPDGWALLRLSLHDPNMPLNVESRKAGGVKVIAREVRSLLQGFSSLDLSPLQGL